MGTEQTLIETPESLQGWIIKEGGTHKTWKRRWFVLKKRDGLLSYYKSHEDAKPTRVIDLRQCNPVKPEFAQLDTGQVQRCIHVPSPIRTFVLYVPDDVEHYRWLSAIEAARQQSRPSKSGWLVKQGERVKNWKRRWFVLLDRQLIYYESEEDVARSKMLGVIDLRQCQVVADADALSKKAFSFAIETPQRRWLLVADSKDERNEWVTVLTFHPEYQSS